jgi:hypothetical protein
MNSFKITFLLAELFLFNLLTYNSIASDTIRVFTHNKELVVTDPSTGAKSHQRWGLFPGKEIPVRQITMYGRFNLKVFVGNTAVFNKRIRYGE